MKLLRITALILLVSFVAAQADTYVWNGDGTSLYWSNWANWVGDTIPVSSTSTDIVLQGNKRNSSYASYNITINSLTLQDTTMGHVVNGKPITIANAITNTSSNQLYLRNELNLMNNQTWSVAQGGDLTIQGAVNATNVNISKVGQGNLSFNGIPGSFNHFSGSLTLTEGTFSLARNNVIGQNLNVTLNGGTLKTNGYNERLGTLTLTADSTIRFSEGNSCNCGDNSSVLVFSNSSNIDWTNGSTLYITDWDGNWNGGGLDQLYVGSSANGLNASQLSQIKFFNPNSLTGIYDARILSTGEIVPVPEPATMVLGSLLAGLVGIDARRRRKLKE